MQLIRTKGRSKYENWRGDETLRGEGYQSVVKATVLNDRFVWHLGADQKQKAIENIPAGMKLSVSASDPTNCFTMLLIEIEGGDFADEGVIRLLNIPIWLYWMVWVGACDEAVNSGIVGVE